MSGLWLVTILLLTWYATHGRGTVFPVTMAVFVHMLVWVPLGSWLITWLTRRNLYGGSWVPRAGLAVRLALLAVYAVAMGFVGRVELFTLPAVGVFLPLAVGLAAAYLYRGWYNRRMMAQHGWSAV